MSTQNAGKPSRKGLLTRLSFLSLLLSFLFLPTTHAFRLVNKTGEGEAFTPGEQGFVGTLADARGD